MPRYTNRTEVRLIEVSDDAVLKAITEFMRHVNSNPILKSSATVHFEVVNPTKVSLRNTVVDCMPTTMFNPTDDYSGFCFNGMMFDHSSAMFYLGGGRSDTFVPILNAKLFMEELIFEQFKVRTNVTKNAIDRYFQLVKLGKPKPEAMLSEIAYKFQSGQTYSTIIETLLRGGGGSTDVKVNVTPKDYSAFTIKFSKIVLEYITLLVNALSKLELVEPSAMNSLILMSKVAEPVVNGSVFTNKIKNMTDNSLHGLTQELSTNPIFNPSSRAMLDKLIDPATKDGFTRSRIVEKDYDNIMTVLNAQDMTREVDSTIFNVAVNIPKDISWESEKWYGFRVDYDKLVRANQVKNAMVSITNNAPTADIVAQTLDTVINSTDDHVIDPNLVGVNNKAIRIMTEFMKEF